MDLEKYLMTAIPAAVKAGQAILEVYRSDFDVEQKSDNSPLTMADRKSNDIILDALSSTQIPVLSEEGRETPYEQRKTWERLWIVDPLDGTKEFIKRNDEFTVNIALVEYGQPILGVIYVPVKNELYFAAQGYGAFKLNNPSVDQLIDFNIGEAGLLDELAAASERLPLAADADKPLTIVGSRSHAGPELEAFVEQKRQEYDRLEFISAGSSLKICLVAEGRADLYPRMGPTCEWDTAAGQAIAEISGAKLLDFKTGEPLRYNRADLLNPWFIVRR